jgi:hypothetical protein
MRLVNLFASHAQMATPVSLKHLHRFIVETAILQTDSINHAINALLVTIAPLRDMKI